MGALFKFEKQVLEAVPSSSNMHFSALVSTLMACLDSSAVLSLLTPLSLGQNLRSFNMPWMPLGICSGRLPSLSRRLWIPAFPALCPTTAACCPSLSKLLLSLQVSVKSLPPDKSRLLVTAVCHLLYCPSQECQSIIKLCLSDSKKPGARTPLSSTEDTAPST